jgi:sn-glycerol 3-phosphate transport system ATP-binding protein
MAIQLTNVKKTFSGKTTVLNNFNLSIQDGSFTVLVGPSGCGKTTVLRIISGLENVTEGNVFIDDRNVTNIDPADRNIAMVFQNYAIYPHMTVRGNIEFGLKNYKISKQDIKKRVDTVLAMTGLLEYADRMPSQLSGGQRQRVALSRAISKSPHAFLMDEPLSNLDAKLRNQMRSELIQLHQQLACTFIYVTHDQTEAMTMGTDIVVMYDGKIMQQGAPKEVYKNPCNIFVAQFIGDPGMNVFLLEDDTYLGFRPRSVTFSDPGANSFRIEGKILTKEFLGHEYLYTIHSDYGSVMARIQDEIENNDDTISLYIRFNDLFFFDRDQNRSAKQSNAKVVRTYHAEA